MPARKIISFSILLILAATIVNAQSTSKEHQITFAPYGHTLNATQVFSPDGQWVVYDTRNDDTHIPRTSTIERVELSTGKTETLYTTKNQTLFGPGVGAAAYHPTREQVLFIHGLENCDEAHPYSFTRRFGAITETSKAGVYAHAEARSIVSPLIQGALRGGTHAHSWSHDGSSISFTYNDQIMEQLEHDSKGNAKDLRTIGMMINTGTGVNIKSESAEEFSGKYFAFVTATVTENPTPGSDEIDRAFDECWIGENGYLKENMQRQSKTVAFQGNVRSSNGQTVTEVFVSDIPNEINRDPQNLLQGSTHTRPHVPPGVSQQRITFTSKNKNSGIQGPRCRLRTSPDGKYIYFHMKDDTGIVQIFRVSTTGGEPQLITSFHKSIEGQYNVSPDGKTMSCISDNKIWLVDLNTKQTNAVTVDNDTAIVGGALWSPDGKRLIYNRYVGTGNDRFIQIFSLELSN